MKDIWEIVKVGVVVRHMATDRPATTMLTLDKAAFDAMSDEELGRWLREKLSGNLAALLRHNPASA